MVFDGWNFGDIFDALPGVLPPELPAIIYGDHVLSWGEFGRRTNNLARALAQGGAQPNDKIAFYTRNHPAYLEGCIAGLKARLVHVNINFRYRADEVRYIVENSDATIVVFAREFSPLVAEIRDSLPQVKRWLIVEDGSAVETPGFAEAFEPLAADGSGEPMEIVRSPDDLYFLYTGGTTGMPKAVMWRHDQLRRILRDPTLARIPQDLNEDLVAVGESYGAITLPACPLMHANGVLAAITALVNGGTVAMLTSPNFDADELWATVEARRVERIVIVGDPFAKPMLRALDAAEGRYDLSCIQTIGSSGAMWSQEVKQGLLRHIPLAALVDSFGASDAGGFGMSITTAAGGAATARFVKFDNVKAFTPDGREVTPGSGEPGMVARHGPLPDGYYKDPGKSAEAYRVIDGVRYAIPGDICTIEADGSITLLGRGSMCINTAGEKVFPEEVEEVLKRHPDIEDALVVGVPDETWGQAVTAVVELRAGAHFDEAALRTYVRGLLAGYKTPKRVVATPQMPRTPSGKADYGDARKLALGALGLTP